LELPFFGLTPEYRLSIFNQIHEIVFHGKGGYTWDAIYNMPIWLRNFTFNKINEFYQQQNKQNNNVKKSIENMKSAGAEAINKKQSPPSYITKASKK
jgi:hypothetical protein